MGFLRGLPLPPVLAPCQRDDDRIEDRECNQAGTRIQYNPVQLVTDEDQQDNDYAGIRPQLVQQQCDDERVLDGAMRQQVDGANSTALPVSPLAVCNR